MNENNFGNIIDNLESNISHTNEDEMLKLSPRDREITEDLEHRKNEPFKRMITALKDIQAKLIQLKDEATKRDTNYSDVKQDLQATKDFIKTQVDEVKHWNEKLPENKQISVKDLNSLISSLEI